jgi:2-oxoglutarate/2-oxoacid ferredoxin oxidoreductase subunit alpha
MKKIFSVKIGGEAGFGIMSAGELFSKIAVRSGLFTFDYIEYPSIIRGGHNIIQIVVGREKIRAPRLNTDFLIALNQQTIDLHKNELSAGSFLIYDEEQKMDISNIPGEVTAINIPFRRLATEISGNILMQNTIVLGAAVALLGGEFGHLSDLIKENFASKNQETIDKNLTAAQTGFEIIKKDKADKIVDWLVPEEKKEQIIASATETISLGAIAAGLQFAAIYPMTPVSNILHFLAPLQEKYKFIYKQPEDEISAINMAIGAAYAGARSMVATSGGGFCLMTEALGLAGQTETPLVVIEGMRGGPSTGLPTWTEQGDLQFVLHASHGDFPRLILAPGDAEEAFYMTMEAFNLAEKYQTPVIIIVDKHICESHISLPLFNYEKYSISRGKMADGINSDYRRYTFSEDGISPRALPGFGNHVLVNSDEHNESGYSDEKADNRRRQTEKRMAKLKICAKEDLPEPILYGPQEAEITIVSWGSNKGAILDAMDSNNNFNFLHLNRINPFPSEAVKNILSKAKRVINVESNPSGQMASLIKEKTGFNNFENFLKYDGRPIYPEEIINLVK